MSFVVSTFSDVLWAICVITEKGSAATVNAFASQIMRHIIMIDHDKNGPTEEYKMVDKIDNRWR